MHQKFKTYQWLLIATLLPLFILLLGDWLNSVYDYHLFDDIIYWLIYIVISLPCFYFTCRNWQIKPLTAILFTLGMWLSWGALMIIIGLMFHTQMGWAL